MPPIARLFLKTAFVYLVAALFIALLIVATPRLKLPAAILMLNPAYFHLFMVGWVMELIVGIAFWMFPKFSRSQPRGSTALAWATYILLNLGLLLRVIAEPILSLQANAFWGWLLALAALLQWLGGLAFVANTWPRIKEK